MVKEIAIALHVDIQSLISTLVEQTAAADRYARLNTERIVRGQQKRARELCKLAGSNYR